MILYSFLLGLLLVSPSFGEIGLCPYEYEKLALNPAIVRDPHFYSHRDPLNPKFFARAKLSATGTLELEFVMKDGSGNRGSLNGAKEFARILAHFGDRVKAIKGSWEEGFGNTNLDAFNRYFQNPAFRGSMASRDLERVLREAAAQTWTGSQARLHGFSEVKAVEVLEDEERGFYTDVKAWFVRPSAGNN